MVPVQVSVNMLLNFLMAVGSHTTHPIIFLNRGQMLCSSVNSSTNTITNYETIDKCPQSKRG